MKYTVETVNVNYTIDLTTTQLNENLDPTVYANSLPKKFVFELEAADLEDLDNKVVEAVKNATGQIAFITYKIL